MKKIILFASIYFLAQHVQAQEFNKQLAEAKSTYSSGKLDDARFAMQQMLQELDIVTGKEVLKILPAKMIDQTQNTANDNVSGVSGYLGTVIHRDYGTGEKTVNLEIISNSPLLASVNALLSLPMIGNSGDNKVIRVAGYKALLSKHSNDSAKPEFEIQVPLNSSLITLRAPGYTQEQIIQMINTIPLPQVAKALQ